MPDHENESTDAGTEVPMPGTDIGPHTYAAEIAGENPAGAVVVPKQKLREYLWTSAPIGILLLTIAVYYKAVFNELTNFDDTSYILQNKYLSDFSWTGVKEIFTSFYGANYHPFTMLTYFVEYHFWGVSPIPYHFTNVLLHLFNTYLVYLLARNLSQNRLTGLIVSTLFAIHPMHVESVAWASERKDVLYSLFYLSALLYYLRYLASGQKIGYYMVVTFLFTCSLFSKSAAVTLPVLLLAFDFYRGRKLSAGMWLEKLPLFALSVVFGILNLKSQHAATLLNDVTILVSGVNRFFFPVSAAAFYIVRSVVPYNFSAMHYFPDFNDGFLPWVYYASLPFLLLLVAGLILLRKKALFKEALFGLAFFFISVSVMLQFVPVGSALTCERYTYIAYIGLFYIIAQGISAIKIVAWKRFAMACMLGATIVFSVQAWFRIGIWKDSETLWNDVINKNQDIFDKSLAHLLRGNARLANGDLSSAMDDYRQAIIQRPDYAEAYTNRGVILFRRGEALPALDDFNKAISLKPGNPRPYSNRASVKASLGDFPGALSDYNSFLKMEPGNGKAHADRGMVRFSLKDYYGACSDWDSASALGDKEAARLLRQFCY